MVDIYVSRGTFVLGESGEDVGEFQLSLTCHLHSLMLFYQNHIDI